MPATLDIPQGPTLDEPQDQEEAPAQTSVLAGINPIPAAEYVGTQDVTDNRNFMSDPEAEVYNNFVKERDAAPSYGPLAENAYYPGYRPGPYGNYSGSVVGSNTLYGGGGALVPLAMMDARDVAVQKAAMQKQKDVEDWRKKFQPPTSKLTNINKNLTNEYIDFVSSSWDKAMKKAGGRPDVAKQILQNDPEFNKQERSYKNVALEGDATATRLAEINHSLSSGELISPALREAKERVVSSLNPNDPEFKNYQQNLAKMNAEMDLSKAINQALLKAVETETGTALDQSDPDFNRIFKSHVSRLSKGVKDAVVFNVGKRYEGSRLYKPEEVEKTTRGMMDYSNYGEDIHVSNKPQDAGDVSDLVPASSDEANVVNAQKLLKQERAQPQLNKQGKPMKNPDGTPMYTTPKTAPVYVDSKHSVYDQATYAKPVKTVIALSALGTDLKKGVIQTKGGNVDAEIGSIANALVYHGLKGDLAQYNGLMVDDSAELDPAVRKNHTKYEPMVPIKYKYVDEAGNTQDESTWQPLKTVRNSLRGKSGRNDKVLEEIERKAGERSEAIKSGGKKKEEPSETTTYTIKGKQYGYSKVKAKADASGMTVEEYLLEANK